MQQEPTGFFDKNTIIAILLSFAVFFGWQQYMDKRYPQKPAEVQKESAAPLEANGDSKAAVETEVVASTVPVKKDGTMEAPAVESQALLLQYPTFDLKISSLGMAISDLTLKQYRRRSGEEMFYKDPIQQIGRAHV